MAEDLPRPRGVLESLRSLSDSVLALLQNRLELFGVELQEQKERLIRVLILTAILAFLVNMAVIVLTITIVVLVGEKARGPVLIGLTLLYAAGATVAFFALRKELRSAPPPFQDTVGELTKDRDWLNNPS
jgi:uncharacterized membrane protein YqjE